MLTIISSHEKCVNEKRKRKQRALGDRKSVWKGLLKGICTGKNSYKTPNEIQLRLALPTGRKGWKDYNGQERAEYKGKDNRKHTNFVCIFFHIGFTTFLRKFNLVALF